MKLLRHDNRWTTGLAFCLPMIVGLGVFTLYPVLRSLYLSFCDYSPLETARWIGTDNYVEMTGDRRFWLSIWNTVSYGLVAVPLGIVVGLGLAVLLNLKVRGQTFYRTMFFLPSITPLIAACVLWNQVLNPGQGIINEGLRFLHWPAEWMPGWLSDESWSKPGLVLMSLWGVGGGMVMYLAALQDVPPELTESAAIDGANAWHRFLHITLPTISPIILFTLIMGMIGVFQEFARPMVMTGGGPMDSTLFYSLYVFNTSFTEYRWGYASAMSWVLFALILWATVAVMRMSNRYVHYQD